MTAHNKSKNRKIIEKLFACEQGTSKIDRDLEDYNSFVLVRNIPSHLHSKDLRVYFSDFIESDLFSCFHYRHRPEVQAPNSAIRGDSHAKRLTCCCLAKLKSSKIRSDFMKSYHLKHWLNAQGLPIPRRCFIDAVKVVNEVVLGSNSITEFDLKNFIELKPPSVMPQGNVGTPSEYFLNQIKLCQLPSSLISKLGLKINRRQRKFEAVSYVYDTGHKLALGDDKCNKKSESTLCNLHVYSKESYDNSIYSDDDLEDFERYEALHDDVTEQDRTKPKKYEEEMEIVWEKGGPGLVWYTDKNYWDEREIGTDCDWAWADDWDVDYSVYYEGKSMGTNDGQHSLEIHEDILKRAGKFNETVFCKKMDPQISRPMQRINIESDQENIEKYSKGIGRKLLSKMGWKPGTGLGKLNQGFIHSVAFQMEEDGQSGNVRRGFGYREERLERFPAQQNCHSLIPSSCALPSNKIQTTYHDVSRNNSWRSVERTEIKADNL